MVKQTLSNSPYIYTSLHNSSQVVVKMSSAGGRPKGLCWEYVEELDIQDGQRVFQCKGKDCTKTKKVSINKRPQASCWFDHLICECKGVDEGTKVKLAEKASSKKVKEWKKSRDNAMKEKITNEIRTAPESENIPAAKRWKQISLDDSENVFDHCDAKRFDDINEAITKCICGNGLSFNLIDSVFFRDLVKKLNSAYHKKMPKQDAFRNTHLPSLYSKTIQQVAEMWNEDGNLPKTFGFDGYTNKGNGLQVLNCTESVGDKTAFVICIDPEEQSEDAQFLAKNVMLQLEKVANYGRSVEEAYAGVVADNTSTNYSAFKIIKNKYPRIFTIGCSTHVSDLMMEDICLLEEIKNIVK